ncbi:hypothetical protein L211DRAFT_432090 [Terfezia boudieri ATCC MYA-4762]|uniref:F-box domain-containing protein n=1 Tax=Terfezia boudieri ATCC MYA-4762 TaxID=1051890 RepID=A0A3N4LIA0_9PEZI|nr:hypothetical protein L211DRAFT_432090 [Terfezia boudieri ATCC MYA-4762]
MALPQPLLPPIYKLPPELLLHVFTFLAHPPSLITAALTCRSFHQQIFDISADKYIWKEAARAVCGFGGKTDKSGDIEGDDANYLEAVRGGVPESLDELWAIGVGPVLIDVKVPEGKKASLKGKERAVDADDAAASTGVVVELKPMYREMCKAQMRWENYFGAQKGAKETTKEVEKLVDTTLLSFQAKPIIPSSVSEVISTAAEAISSKAEGTTRQTSRRSARIAVKKKQAEQAAAKEEMPSVAPKRAIKRKSTGSDHGESLPSKTARKAKAPRYGRVHTSLPSLSTLPPNLVKTHYTKRIFSIVHTETEGSRSELEPPIVSVKMPSWGEQLDSYPLGKQSMTLTLHEQRQSDTKRDKRNRELAQGGVRDNIAFFLFSDDPRMLYGERGAINDDSRYTVRRGVVGGSFGAPPLGECIVVNTKARTGKMAVITQEKSQQEKDEDGDITMVSGQENGIGSRLQESASTVTNGLSIIERTRTAIYGLSDKIRDVSTEEFYGLYRMDQLPENNEPWLHQGKSYSIATTEFIRPVPYTTCFPSFKKLDRNRTLKKSIVEHFPSLKNILGMDEQSTTGLSTDGTALPMPDLGLDYNRLQKLGLSNLQLNRWAKNNIHSDANLRLVPELRKIKEKDGKTISVNEETLPAIFLGRTPPDLAGLEVAEVERLTVDYDDNNNELEVKTKVNLRWRMPKCQDLLSLKPPFERPSLAMPPPPASSTAGPSTAAASTPIGTASASAPGATTASTPAVHIHPFAPIPPSPWAISHHIAYHYQNQPHSASMNINAISAVGAITSADLAHLLYTVPDTETTWEFRSRGPYLVSCDDNDGVAPSTLTCFRARPGHQAGEMGDMLWQRLLAVPLHYKDARLSVSAELRTKEQLHNLMHEFYYMDNDGFRLTSSMVIYATRRHIISPQLLIQHRKELARDVAAEFQAQTQSGLERTATQRAEALKRMNALSQRMNRDKWGTGTATGYKGCCEFWFFALENGHTVKIVSLKEEIREVTGAWRGWVNWDVNDAGGLVASVGGIMDTKWKEVVRKVTKLGEMPTIGKSAQGGDKGKKKDKDKGKGKGKASAPNVKTRSRAKANENGDLEGFEGDGGTTDYDDEVANGPQCNCPACSSDVFFDGYEDVYGDYSDYDDEFTSDEEPLDPRPAAREPQYHHRYLFCWDFKAHSTDSSTSSNPGLELLPLPSRTWWNNDYDHGVYVTFSPCSRYIAASSNFRFALWDLEDKLDKLGERHEDLQYPRYRRGGNSIDSSRTQMSLLRSRRPQMWKVPKMDLHRWTRGGLFDTWHDREHYSTQAEDLDELVCKPFNGIWVLWEDVAIPRKYPIADTASSPSPTTLGKGVSFINSIDLRRYVDGVDMGADLEQRMEDYHNTLQVIYEERQDEIDEAEMADDDDDAWLDDDSFEHQHFAMYHAQFAAMHPGMTDEDDWGGDDDNDDDDIDDGDSGGIGGDYGDDLSGDYDEDYENEDTYNVFGMLQELL